MWPVFYVSRLHFLMTFSLVPIFKPGRPRSLSQFNFFQYCPAAAVLNSWPGEVAQTAVRCTSHLLPRLPHMWHPHKPPTQEVPTHDIQFIGSFSNENIIAKATRGLWMPRTNSLHCTTAPSSCPSIIFFFDGIPTSIWRFVDAQGHRPVAPPPPPFLQGKHYWCCPAALHKLTFLLGGQQAWLAGVVHCGWQRCPLR